MTRPSRWLPIPILAALLTAAAFAQTQTAPVLPVTVLAQSPADTKTDLQIFCLFRSSPENTLHGSLAEIDERLHGLLTRMRGSGLFGGELGETLLLTPPPGTLAARRVLVIGLGDSATFTPESMYLVGKIALRESDRLGVAHPFFAPTVLDGGVSRFGTGEVAERAVHGMDDALKGERLLRTSGAAGPPAVVDFTYLAGAAHAADTQAAIDHALGRSAAPLSK